METVRKQITLDAVRSHRNSIQPYCSFDSEDSGPFDVTEDTPNGTFGQFACDYGVISDEKVISRMAYLDVLRKYRYTQQQISQGIPVVLVDDNTVTITNTDDCNYDVSFSGSLVSRWSTHVPEHEKYDYKPADIDFFTKDEDGYYYYTGTAEVDDEDEAVDTIGDAKALLLIPNYSEVTEYEVDWEQWWSNAFNLVEPQGADRWEKAFLDENYVDPEGFFKFCQDFEKYTLGLVNVPQDIEGPKVPEVVFYLNYKDYIKWFDDCRDIHEQDIAFEREWEARGGDDFYYFLQRIEPKWITRREDTPDETYFTYVIPVINMGFLMTDNSLSEWEYAPYEFSLIDGEVVDVTEPYSCPSSGAGSALTPHFVTFNSGITVESILGSLISNEARMIGNEMGIFEKFNDEGDGQLFKCTFHQETSSEPKVEIYYSGKTTITKTRNTHIEETGETYVEYINDVTVLPETYQETIEEVAPKVKSNCYQVVGLEISSSTTRIEASDTPVIVDDEERYYWSAITKNTYEWWECEKIDTPDNIRCADGEVVVSGDTTKYKSVLLLSMVPSVADSEVEGGVYYFMALCDNGNISGEEKAWIAGETEVTDTCEIKSVKVPFVEGEIKNYMTFNDGTIAYDTIISMAEEGDNMDIEYVAGATSGADITQSGIHYKEVIPFEKGKKVEVAADGMTVAEVYFDSLDFESVRRYIYYDEYETGREFWPAEVTGMEVGTTWTEDNAMTTKLITREGLGAVNGDLKFDISVAIDRGTGAAWENYFKLSECNTFNDLANYSNNFFNL